ncbi:MAG: hypothetical protein Q9224_007424 [Gallowayella concinna]
MAYLDLAAYSYSIPTATVILLLVFFSKYIYRLTFHPLARFPGPKLAAATNLYGASIDLLTSGSYVKEFPALHEKYGPVIRVWPNHLHFRDIGVYDE